MVYEREKANSKLKKYSNRRPGEIPKNLKTEGQHTGKYIIRFKRKDLRENKTDDKYEIFTKALGLGDYNDRVDLTTVFKSKAIRRNTNTGRNQSDNEAAIIPHHSTIMDINRYDIPVLVSLLTDEQVAKLSKNPNVLRIEKDRLHKPHAQQTPWGVSRLKAPESWTTNSNRRGRGVIVVIADTGVDVTHPDLIGSVAGGIVTYPGDGTRWQITSRDSSDVWHGTHTTGTLCSQDNSIGVVGVAPGVQLFMCRIGALDDGVASDSSQLAALNYGISIFANVWTMSFSGGGIPEYVDLVNACHEQHKMFLTASAGNEGIHDMSGEVLVMEQNQSSAPPGICEITALDSSGNDVVDWSNWGAKTEFAAPGVDILSTLPGNKYESWEGTSMACPHVAGVAALAFEALRFDPCQDVYKYSPNNNAKLIRKMMQITADKMGKFSDRDPNNALGYGVPDADTLVSKILNPNGLVLAGVA